MLTAKTQISLGIRVFAVCMKKVWVLSDPLSAQRRFWSDWADAQADLSLPWVHSHFVGFVMRQLIYGYKMDQRNSIWSMLGCLKITGIIIWASSWENLSSGFATRVDSNRPAQPQKLARVMKLPTSEISYYLGSEQQRCWSDCVDAHADLHLCCCIILWH